MQTNLSNPKFAMRGFVNPLLLFLMAALVACTSSAPAGPKIEIEDVWSRSAKAMGEMSSESGGENVEMGHTKSGTGAVFMKLVNQGQEADRLTGAQTDVAEVAEVHETRIEGDVMKMQLLPNGLEIPAEGEVLLEPGGYHVMLIGIKRDLNLGDTITVVLEFEKSGSMTVDAPVKQP